MATADFKTSVSQFNESIYAQTLTGMTPLNTSRTVQSPDGFKVIKEHLLQHYGPVLRHKEMIKVLSMGRSTSFVKIKDDPTFPKGFAIFDSVNSPKIYWTHEVISWLEARSNKCRNMKEGN